MSRTITSSTNRIDTQNFCSLKCSAAARSTQSPEGEIFESRIPDLPYRSTSGPMRKSAGRARSRTILSSYYHFHFSWLLSFSFFAQTFRRLPTFTHDGAILYVRCARLIARDKMRKSVRAAQQWLPDYGQATFACTNPSIATRNSVENFSPCHLARVQFIR